MSGVVHSIGKAFSKVWDFIRPVVEIAAVAAAIYFTAGVALSYFPATSAFAASLPGFASTGGIAGQGVFSSLASSIGMGGGLQAGAAADFAAADSAAVASEVAAGSVPVTQGVGSAAAAAAGSAAPGAGWVAGTVTQGAASGVGTAAATAAKMSLTDKLLLASVGTQAISGLTAPTPADIQAARNAFYGSFYGNGTPGPNLSVGPQTEVRNNAPSASSQVASPPSPGVAPTPASTTRAPMAIPGINIPLPATATSTGAPAINSPGLPAQPPAPKLIQPEPLSAAAGGAAIGGASSAPPSFQLAPTAAPQPKLIGSPA